MWDDLDLARLFKYILDYGQLLGCPPCGFIIVCQQQWFWVDYGVAVDVPSGLR